VGNPGNGKVFISTALGLFGPITLINFFSNSICTPVSSNFTINGFNNIGSAFSIKTSPPVIAAAII
jgi:hypothetical protein